MGCSWEKKEVQRQTETETERGEGLPLTEVAIQEKEQGGLGEGWEFGRNQKETQHKARRMLVSFWRMRLRMRMRLISLQR